MPCTSDTTAMIDVTATMFPSTVRNDRSLFAQIAPSAMRAASRNWFTLRLGGCSALGGLDLDGGAIGELAHGAERPHDHAVAFLEPADDFEVLPTDDAGLDRHELRL